MPSRSGRSCADWRNYRATGNPTYYKIKILVEEKFEFLSENVDLGVFDDGDFEIRGLELKFESN